MGRPVMFMLAGPNGAGKSSLYETVIRPRIDAPFINADLIQRDELKDPSMQASYRAAEIAEERRQAHLAKGQDFVSESTFSHPSKLALVDSAIEAGFRVVIFHVNVRSADLSVDRVARRTEEGGHDVPEDKIRERYARNQSLIREAILKSDRAFVYDNSLLNKPAARAIEFKAGQVIWVSGLVPAWARDLYATELQDFAPATLNPAAASFADARGLVQALGGPGAALRIPEHGAGQAYRGQLVGETAMHWVQQVGEGLYMAHFKTALPRHLQVHRVCEIHYPQVGRSIVHELGRMDAIKTARAAQGQGSGRPARAQAFENESRASALARFPELAGAYAILDAVEAKVLRDYPANPRAQSLVMRASKVATIRSLDAGQIPAGNAVAQGVKRGGTPEPAADRALLRAVAPSKKGPSR